jgi:nucleoside-diphosphate-sugar epimerase
MNILITGISGFVGSNLVKSFAFLPNITIYGLDIMNPKLENVKGVFDWDKLNTLPDVDVIIHLAGKAHDTKNQTNAEVYFDINTGLTKRIYDWFLKSNAKKFVFFSSVKAVADTVMGYILTEDTKPNPKGPYGESKIAAENYILANLSINKKIYILRPCMIHGPGNKGNLNILHKIVSKGMPWPLGAFDNKRSFCSIENVSFVIREILEKDIDSGVYQVADDKSLSTNALIALISESVGKNASVLHINKGFIRYFAKLGDILNLPLNTERLKKLTESYLVSNEKLKNALNLNELPITAQEGMRKTLESFRVE